MPFLVFITLVSSNDVTHRRITSCMGTLSFHQKLDQTVGKVVQIFSFNQTENIQTGFQFSSEEDEVGGANSVVLSWKSAGQKFMAQK